VVLSRLRTERQSPGLFFALCGGDQGAGSREEVFMTTLTAKPMFWDSDLVALRGRLWRAQNRGIIESLARHLVRVHARSGGLLRSFAKLG
jgi:hypothetical protein